MQRTERQNELVITPDAVAEHCFRRLTSTIARNGSTPSFELRQPHASFRVAGKRIDVYVEIRDGVVIKSSWLTPTVKIELLY